MAKVSILIVEDEAEQAEKLREQLEQLDYKVSGIAHDLTTALGLFYSLQPDLVVVDIYLNGKTEGITFARKLQENPSASRPFIFLTAHADMQTFREAKMTLPFSYLLKPFNPLELQYAIELALEKSQEEEQPVSLRSGGYVAKSDILFVKKGHALVKIHYDDINLVEVQGKYCKLVTTQGDFLVQNTLKNLLDTLGNQSFIKTHRNFLVNIKSIKQVLPQDDMLVLNNGQEVPVSQSYKKQLNQLLRVLK